VPVPEQYCTLFDRNYLPRALVLYRSLERVCDSFVLRALCMDDETLVLLDRLGLPHLRAIAIADLLREDAELEGARATRSPKEFCWTCTPAICRFVLHDEPDLETITYLDADLCFWSSPAPLHAELSGGSIQLVPHRDSQHASDAGIYNVGWNTFRNDENGRSALDWWRERCIEWCYDRLEPGRFGDQKYLDDWPTRFAGVTVTSNPAVGLDPSSDGGHHLATSPAGAILVDRTPLICYHYAGLRVHAATPRSRLLARRTQLYRNTGNLVWTVLGQPPPEVLNLLWEPYLQLLSHAHGELTAVGGAPSLGLNSVSLRVALRQAARHRMPTAARQIYRRIPAGLRSTIARWLSPS
jgi:hypothetical protein